MTRAHQLADFDCGETGAAGGAQHRKRLAGLEFGPVLQRMQRRAVGDGEAGRAVEVQAGRQCNELVGGKGDPLARGAPADIADDAVAGRKAGDAGSDAFDFAGELGAGREREGRLVLVLAGDDQRVEEVQRGGRDPHDRLARRRRRIGDVGEFEVVGRAVAGAEQGFHDGSVEGFR